MNISKLTNLLIVAGLSAATAANAASHRKIIFVNQYDLNQDWQLTELEFEQARLNRFNATDSDKSGSVNPDEYLFEYKNRLDTQMAKDRKGSVKQTIIRFDSLDKNDDKQMVWEEYNRSGDWAFNHFDSNKDGTIDGDDKEPEYKPRKAKEEKSETEILNEKVARARVTLRMPTTHNMKGMFVIYDSNEDGKISKEEYTGYRRAKFDETDSDNNGWISEEEYLFEFENRLDKQAEKIRKRAIKQTHVRFNALDTNKDGEMTMTEYMASGHRSFNRWDTDENHVVNFDDKEPKRRHKEANKKKDKKASKDSKVAQNNGAAY